MPYKDKEKKKEAQKRYRESTKGKFNAKKNQKKYAETEAGKEIRRKAQRKYRASSKGKQTNKKYYKSDKGKLQNANHQLKQKYGIDLDTKQSMFDTQNGLCSLCGLKLRTMRSSCVEHCHTYGTIRGLVHTRCNIFIGLVEENPNLLKHIKLYLK